jgi:bifunctional UDP-N-acetylglucosamine pyrophosphorylase/glucosamine-1-phosphate N-acetyltransferase
MVETIAVILAAGEGKRMKSSVPKVLHTICGRPMVSHVLAAVKEICAEQIMVVGHGAEIVQAALGDSVRYVLQEKQLGTGHALMQALPLLPAEGTVFILCGDTPLLSADMLGILQEAHRESEAAATVLTAFVPDAKGYGRIIRSSTGMLQKIVEEKDAVDEERAVREINTGTYVFAAGALHKALGSLQNNNAQGEYYLTDCIEWLVKEGQTVATCCTADFRLAMGVNDRVQLADATALMQRKIHVELMLAGVTIIDPASTYVDAGVEVGYDTVLYPGTMLRGGTRIGPDCIIGPNCEITDSLIGSGVTVRHSVITGSILADSVTVGPYAHLRPETKLHPGVKVGDFVEIKKSEVGTGSKIPHLAYVGDAQIGSHVNLGAGVIVVNYDGRQKHVTRIDDHAFIGCNSNLVAPLHIGKGAFVAAGSTITKEIEAGSLALARAKQVNKERMASRFINTGDKD